MMLSELSRSIARKVEVFPVFIHCRHVDDVGRDGDGGDVDGDYDDSDVDAVQSTSRSQARTKTETKAKY